MKDWQFMNEHIEFLYKWWNYGKWNLIPIQIRILNDVFKSGSSFYKEYHPLIGI